MKKFLITLLITSGLCAVKAQTTTYEHTRFCSNLNRVLESGRMENFESLASMRTKQSSMLQVPGMAIKLEQFPVVYVDKDSRFVGKTLLSMDSVSSLKKLDELSNFVGFCLDSTLWTPWMDTMGDDSTTVFFREEKVLKTRSADLTINLALVRVNEFIRTVNLYITRGK